MGRRGRQVGGGCGRCRLPGASVTAGTSASDVCLSQSGMRGSSVAQDSWSDRMQRRHTPRVLKVGGYLMSRADSMASMDDSASG